MSGGVGVGRAKRSPTQNSVEFRPLEWTSIVRSNGKSNLHKLGWTFVDRWT